ncbi:MAG: hypothetical protein ACRELA_18800 [Candidatus Rokuibacteriota bacterium]
MSRTLLAVSVGAPILGLAYAAATSKVFPYDARPGAPVGQTLGVIAAGLMIATLLYLPAKRGDVLTVPNRRLALLHIILGSVGAAVALAHSRLVVTEPPFLVLLAFLGLLATGLYGRLVASQRLGPTFGRGGNPFRSGGGPPDELRAFAARKRALLARVDPGAREATFTLSLGHWNRQPLRSLRYYVLSFEERRRMRALEAAGYRERMGLLEQVWRVGHLLLAWLAILGLLAHVTTTLFFADFAAGGREIYWWHLRK